MTEHLTNDEDGDSPHSNTPAELATESPVLRAFATYLQRVLGETDSGSVQVLWDADQPSPETNVAVVVGHRGRWWRRRARRHTGLHRTFKGVAEGDGAVNALPVEILDRWDPHSLPPTPSEFEVLAIMATFNEIDIIDGTIRYLRNDGINVHLIDNWSTDGTFEVLQSWALRDGGVTVERFPAVGPSEYFELETILARVEDVAHHSAADWVINHDADERREAPWSKVSLRRGIYAVDQFGFNCVDHTIINFRPIDDSWDGSRQLVDAFSFFEFGEGEGYFNQKKAWKPSADKALFAATGGHNATFSGRRIFPYKFLTRHYPIRSNAHGKRKVLDERQPRWSPDERGRGWHVHYDDFSESSSFLWERSELHNVTELNEQLLIERLSGAGLRGNPLPEESLDRK